MSGEYISTQNLKITNYKPIEGREAQIGDINITNDENGKFQITNKNHKALMNALAGLDNNNSNVSLEDLNASKSLVGQHNISQVLLDTTAKVARFVFNDGSDFRIDMGINDKPAIKSIQQEITNGNARYCDGLVNLLIQCLTPDTPQKGPEIVISTLPENVKTLGDVKKYYNLPDGCLRNNVKNGGGNFDTYEAEAPIYIHVETLAKGLGVTPDQVEALFKMQ